MAAAAHAAPPTITIVWNRLCAERLSAFDWLVVDEAGRPAVAVPDTAALSAADTGDDAAKEEAGDAETSAVDTDVDDTDDAGDTVDEVDEVEVTGTADVSATATDADEAEAAAADVLDIEDDAAAALELLCALSWLITYCLAKSGLYPVWFSACSFMSALSITIADYGLRTKRSRFAQSGMTVVLGTRP
jgi:hypothetical protein